MAQSTVEYPKRDNVDLIGEAPIRVLHVDDEPGFLKAAKQILEMQGTFEVDTASSVEEAEERMKQKPFDVIVSDYIMPGKDGLEFLKELRESGNNIPFIIFTGRGREIVAIRALNLGADLYVNKIGDPETVYSELAHGIRKLVEAKRVEDALVESEEKWRTLAEQSPNMIFVNKKGKVVYANKRCSEIMGYTKEELYAPDFDFLTLIHPGHRDTVKASFTRHLKGEEVKPCEYALLTKEGKKIEAIITTKLIKYEGENAILGIITNITERKQAEERLRASEERYRSLFENAGYIAITFDLKGKVTSINKAAEEYGFKKDEIIGRNMLKLVSKKYWPRLLKDVAQLARGKPVTGKIEIDTPKGKRIAEYSSNPITVKGSVVGIQSVLRDITERNKTEEEVKRARDRYRSITNLTGDIIVHVDKDGICTFLNDGACKFWGKPREKLSGIKFADYLHPDDQEKAAAAVQKLIKTKQMVKGVTNRQKTPRGWRTVEWNGAPLFDETGNYTGFQATGRDITERKKAEEMLRNSEQRLRDIIDSSPDAIIWVDTAGKITMVNRKGFEITGFSEKDLVGNFFMEVKALTQESKEKILEAFKKRLQGIDTPPYEIELVTKNGEVIPAELSSSSLYEKGKIVGTQSILRDLRERKKVEEALRRSEEKYRNIFDLAPDGIITVDLKGVITSANPTFLKLAGYSKEEIVGKHFTKLGTIRMRDIPRYLKLMSSALRGKLPPKFEYSYVRKDGTVGWAEGHFGFLRENGKLVGFQGILRELTEQRKAEKAVEETRQKFKRLFNGNPEAVVYSDSDYRILDVNPRFTELFGYSLDEIRGKHINDVVVPKEKISEAETLDRKAKKGLVYHDTVRKKKDGTLVPVSISIAPLIIKGKMLGYIGQYKDISRMKKAEKELKRTLEKLETINEKLDVVGKLTRHDARNKLSTVTMNTFLIKQKLADDPEALKHLSEIESACGEVEEIFDFARMYEKIGVEELRFMNIEKTLEETVRLFSDLQGAKVVNECKGLIVRADSLLRQLFFNLIDNSLKHGGKVSQIRVYYKEAGKDRLNLVYEDNGVGVPKAEKEKIFMEGYGKGTGYGLYLAMKMCEVYGWTIRETGKQGRGAKFTMTMPRIGKSGKENYRLPKY